jgi:hypothetical protein
MTDYYYKLYGWYSNLPWYYKLLGCGIIVLLVLLALFELFQTRDTSLSNLKEVDQQEKTKVDNDLAVLDAEESEITKQIRVRTDELAIQKKETVEVLEQATKRNVEIDQATTMAQLDEIQRKYNL